MNRLYLKIDKGLSSDNAVDTYFYIDNVRAQSGELEIVEENNYYPFGLKHNGYNNQVSANANQVARYFRFGGKEYQQELGIGWYDITARNYDPALGRWMNLDPLAEKYYSYSPYNSVLNNPIRNIDPDGMDVYILFYTEGNKEGDEAFKAAAKTRKQDLEESENFNSEEDIVVMVGISDISDIKDQTESIISKHSEKYGKTAEVGVWSHGAFDGPSGSEPTSENPQDSHQMSLDGWESIDFNWKSDESSSFNMYGCNTGNEGGNTGPNGGKSFADKLSRLKNFRKDGVSVSGQTTPSYPSFSPYERISNFTRSSEKPGLGFSVGKTYMVGGNYGEGKKAIGLKGPYPTANPMVTYKKGGYMGKSYKPNTVNR